MEKEINTLQKNMTLWQKIMLVFFREEGVCINCLRCVEACPENKHPNYLLFSAENNSIENAEKQNTDSLRKSVEASVAVVGEEGRGSDSMKCIQCKKCEEVCPAGFSFFENKTRQ